MDEGRGDRSSIAETLRAAPTFVGWNADPGAQTARHRGWQWPSPVQPDEDAASGALRPGVRLLLPSASAASSGSLDTELMASRAAEVVEILGEIAEMSRVQRRSANELAEERRLLAAREAALLEECGEAQRLAQRLQSEMNQKLSMRFEAESLSAELDEERQRSRAQRQAAKRMRQRYDQKLEEQAEELRRVLEMAEQREQLQQLQQRSSARTSIAQTPPARAVLDKDLPVTPSAAVDSGRWPFENQVDHALSAAAPPEHPLTVGHPVEEAAPARSPADQTLGPVVEPQFSAGNLTEQLPPSSCPIEHSLSTGSLWATSNLEPLVEVEAEVEGGEAKVREVPPAGLVAEKVGIFEQRCQGVPAALRRGSHSAPVPTPLGIARLRRDHSGSKLAGR